MKKILTAALGLFLLQGTAVHAELDPVQQYDNFNTKKINGCKFCIDSEKWRGGERGKYIAEISRKIQGKRARLSHRSWAGDDSDEGGENARNRLQFRDSENFSGVCFVPRVLKYEINRCPGNDYAGSAQIRYVGNFYDANTDDPDDGEIGNVYAWGGLRLWSDSGLKKKRFHVSGNASECADEDCFDDAWSTYDGVDIDPNIWFDNVEMYRLRP